MWIFATKVDEGISFGAVSHRNHNAFDGDLLTDVLMASASVIVELV